MTSSERRVVALFVLVVAAAVVGERFLPRAPAPEARDRAEVASAAGAAYCPAPNADEARTFAVTANPGDAPAVLRRSSTGEGRSSPLQTVPLPPGTLGPAEVGSFGIREAAGVVESFSAPAVTDSVVLGRGAGAATAPCTGQPATRWLFASGSTSRDSDTWLLVSNPFTEEASVGVRLLTREGPATLPRLREYTVRPLSEAVIFLADYHPENDSFGIDLTVSRGRLVVSRYMRVEPRGLSVALGARAPATRWQFAAGEVPGESGEELINLANPADEEALVQVVFQTATQQVAPAELEEVAVPAGSHVVVKVSDRLPRGTKHGTTVHSTNGVGIVAERLTRAASGGLRGFESVTGLTQTPARWSVQLGTPSGGTQQLALVNTAMADRSAAVAVVTPKGLVRPPELSALAVGAGRQVTVDLSPWVGEEPALALVEASGGGVVPEGRVFLGDPYLDFADAPARPRP